MNWSSWIDPERSMSDEKNTVWNVLGDSWILLVRIRIIYLPYLNKCILQLLEVDGSTFISVEEVERSLVHEKREDNTHLPPPHFIKKAFEFLEAQLATRRKN